MKRTLLILIAAIVLASCGGSTPDQRAHLIATCVKDGTSHSACICTIDAAAALGDKPGTIFQEKANGTLKADHRFAKAVFSCYGQ